MSRSFSSLMAAAGCLLAVMLAGCGHKYPATTCLPPTVDLPAADAPSATTDEINFPIDLYYDASESMAGYIRGGEAGDVRPLQDLVNLTVGPSASLGRSVRTFFFGAGIHPVAPNDLTRLEKVDAYVCNKKADPHCDNRETHLDTVFNAIADAPHDHLSVIVTDLWLSNNELLSSREVALGVPIRRLFEAGKSVILMGVATPYVGPIYDIPGVDQAPQWSKQRPLFLLLIGPLDKAEQFRKRLLDLQTPSFAAARVHSSVFAATAPPGGESVSWQPPSGAGSAALAPATVLDPHYRLGAVPQFNLRPTAALRLAPGAAAYTATLHPAASAPSDWVWRGPLTGKASVWMLPDPARLATCPAAWRQVGEVAGAWSIKGPDEATATLDPRSPDLERLPPGRDYLIAFQLIPGALQRPNPATQWMRDWSFEDPDGPRLVRSAPDVFPTYKLAETATLFEQGLDSVRPTSPHPLVSAPVLVSVTR